MNGRVYDPQLGRFLSVDPVVQTIALSQALNPYSYVMNNPLTLIDPSGYSWLSKLFSNIGSFLKKWGGTIIDIAFTVVGMPYVGALLGSAFSNVANGGNFGSFLTGFAIGGAVGALASYTLGPLANSISSSLGISADTLTAKVFAGAVIGGFAGGGTAALTGHSFWSGFGGGIVTGGLTAWAMFNQGDASGGRSSNQSSPPSALQRFNNVLGSVVGKVWALPATLVGTIYGGIGYIVGALEGTNPGIAFSNNAIEFTNNPLTLADTAITIGNAINFGIGTNPAEGGAYGDLSVNNGAHEEGHTYQYQILGALFVPAYFMAGSPASLQNPFEAGAQRYGGGKGGWWPW